MSRHYFTSLFSSSSGSTYLGRGYHLGSVWAFDLYSAVNNGPLLTWAMRGPWLIFFYPLSPERTNELNPQILESNQSTIMIQIGKWYMAAAAVGVRRCPLPIATGRKTEAVSITTPSNWRTLESTTSNSIPRRRRVLTLCTAAASAESSGAVEAPPENQISLKDTANTLEMRVGRILKAWRHEEADSLYVEEVDLGEPLPRTICSGLVNYIPLDLLQDANVVVLANLKPRNMRGVKSSGMLMAASDASHDNVELLVPPPGSSPGDRIWFGSEQDGDDLPDPASPNQVQKKKIWELVQPNLKTDESCTAMLVGEHLMRTSAGVVVCKSLKNANIS